MATDALWGTLLGGVLGLGGVCLQSVLQNIADKKRQKEQFKKLQLELRAEFFNLLLAKEIGMGVSGVMIAVDAKRLEWESKFNSTIVKISLYGDKEFVKIIHDNRKEFSKLTNPMTASKFDNRIIYPIINDLRKNLLKDDIDSDTYNELEELRIK